MFLFYFCSLQFINLLLVMIILNKGLVCFHFFFSELAKTCNRVYVSQLEKLTLEY